jgi:glycosyltransferase involved in cell wall biosynthesis
MFALAANGFMKPSETFIRMHARLLAPGNTLLVAERRGLKRPVPAPMVVSSKQWPTFVRPDASACGVVASALDPRRFGRSRTDYLRHILDEAGVRVIMAEYGPVGLGLLPVARALGCPLFVHFHGVDVSRIARDPGRLHAYRTLFAEVRGVIAPSAFIARQLETLGCDAAKLSAVPCGVAVEATPETQRRAGEIVAVGRLVPKKGPLHTLRSFAAIAASHPAARLTMIGGGPLLPQARALVQELGLGARVDLPGPLGHAETLRRVGQASIFVQHSITAADGDIEGLPVSILEAMAASVPVVATRHSGIPEAVEDGVTGLLVDEGDTDAMARCLGRLLGHPTEALALGRAGRARAERLFSVRVTIPALQRRLGLPVIVP